MTAHATGSRRARPIILAATDLPDMTQIKKRLRPTSAFSFAAPLLVALTATAQDQPQDLPATTLQVGMYKIRAQVAVTPLQRQIGLMFRRDMPMHEGMLFVFDEASSQCFWMRNTLLPLSVAFLADDGSVVNIADMQPQSDDSHCSAKPVRYVLEMNQGWFAKRGVKPGTRIAGEVFRK
jgi:uncharacterized membrane protein (UPF0127 family)